MNDTVTALLCALAVAGLVGAAEGARRFLGVPARLTRMSVHITSGSVAALAPWLFQTRWAPFTIAALAAVLLFPTVRRGLLPALHDARPGSLGTVWFAVTAALLFLVAWDHPPLVSLPLLVLAFADPAGMLTGEGLVRPGMLPGRLDGKSLSGAVAVFLVTGLAVTLGWEAFGLGPVGRALLVGLACAPVAMAAEALGDRGLDNVTLPLAVAFTLVLILGDWYGQPAALLAAEAAAAAVAVATVRWRLLTLDGALGAFLLATWTLGGGGWPWVLPLLAFFLPASLLSRWREAARPDPLRLAAKGARRDLGQVAANGGPALAVFIAWVLGLPTGLAWPAFLGALAAAAADTWATEVGTASGVRPRLITTGRPVPLGTSGGVSLPGSLGGVVGALLVAVCGLLLTPGGFARPFQPVLLAAVAGWLASFGDSLLGATLQAQYRCRGCGVLSDRIGHCEGAESDLARGYHGLTNDGVNLVASSVGALLALLAARLMGAGAF